MADGPIDPKALDRPWRLWASVAIGSALVVGAVFAFLILPSFQRENAGVDLWTAFCRSVGLVEGSPAYRQPRSDAMPLPVSQVSWGPGVFDRLAGAQAERGAQVAGQVCASCHGEQGVSATPELPSLVGQTPAAIYKQLHDYRTGARVHPQMSPVASQLGEADLANVAAHYGKGGDVNGLGARQGFGDAAIVRLVQEGDSVRRIPACNSCHVNGAGGPIEAPILTGQHSAYLAAQLRLYKSGQRRNDVYRRMRGIASELSEEEIDAVARYYQGVL